MQLNDNINKLLGENDALKFRIGELENQVVQAKSLENQLNEADRKIHNLTNEVASLEQNSKRLEGRAP